MNKLIQHL